MDQHVVVVFFVVGGVDGRIVVDRLLPAINSLLSARGCFYMVAVEENKPKQLMRQMTQLGFEAKEVIRRRAFNELLYILKFTKIS